MFSGFRSRWTIPRACADPTPAQTAIMIARDCRERGACALCEPRGERLPFQQVHDHDGRAIGELHHVVHLHDAGVPHRARQRASRKKRWSTSRDALRAATFTNLRATDFRVTTCRRAAQTMPIPPFAEPPVEAKTRPR